mmetsp:Transcript_15977/g.40724  ORF Transcript_15977/g.40724 Transcript_15977/m.40724 type:complete len:241 (-) Transcript_15977:67-789(-)
MECLADGMSMTTDSNRDGAEQLRLFGAKMIFKDQVSQSGGSPHSPMSSFSKNGDSASERSQSFKPSSPQERSRDSSRSPSANASRRPSRVGGMLTSQLPPGTRVRRGSAPTTLATEEDKKALQDLLRQCPDPEDNQAGTRAPQPDHHLRISQGRVPVVHDESSGRGRPPLQSLQTVRPHRPHRSEDDSTLPQANLPGGSGSAIVHGAPPARVGRRGSAPAMCTARILQQLNEEHPELTAG